MPIISGLFLLGFGIAATAMKFEVSPAVLAIVLLGAVFVAFPDLRTVKIAKDGISFERPPLGRIDAKQRGTAIGRGAATPEFDRAHAALHGGAIAFFFGAFSGAVAAVAGSLTGDLDLSGPINLITIPKLAPIVYTIALVAFARLAVGIKVSVFDLAVFVGVYIAWYAAIEFMVYASSANSFLGDTLLSRTLYSIASGSIGAAISAVAVAARHRAFRDLRAVALMILFGGLSGALLIVDVVRWAGVTGELGKYLSFCPLFIAWQASTMAVIGYRLAGRPVELQL